MSGAGARRFRLTIGGLSFAVTSDLPVDISFDRAYLEFISTEDAGADPVVDVHLRTGELPGLAGTARVFDAGGSWSLYRDDAGEKIALRRSTEETPYCVVSLYDEPLSVHIDVDESLVRDGILINPLRYPLDQLLLIHLLPRLSGLILHATGVVIAGRGYVLAGRSGAGKTTIARELARRADVEMLSDDRVIVRKQGTGFAVHGTPWPGEGGMAANRVVPLAGLYFLEQAPRDEIIPLAVEDGFARVPPVASIPWYDQDLASSALGLCHEFASVVPCGRFLFRPGPGAGGLLAEIARLPPPE